ncbi:hypothetical protein HK101_002665 [Irineochytrium annulatum]|nr:hypothetical protein HK101_002665 [Irineochytrium annulatum]
MGVSTINASTPAISTFRNALIDPNSLVANIDLPAAAVPPSTQAYYQYVLTDLLATAGSNRVSATVLCPWGATNGTIVDCPPLDPSSNESVNLGQSCIEQQCAFPVPQAGSFPASTYLIEIWTCLSSVGRNECASVEETFSFTRFSTFNFTIGTNGVWTGTWGSTSPGPSAVPFTLAASTTIASSTPIIITATDNDAPVITPTTTSATSPSSAADANASASSSTPASSTILIIVAVCAVIVLAVVVGLTLLYRRRANKSGHAPTSSDAPGLYRPFSVTSPSTGPTTFYLPPQSTSMQPLSSQDGCGQDLRYLPSMRQPDFSTNPHPHQQGQSQQYVGVDQTMQSSMASYDPLGHSLADHGQLRTEPAPTSSMMSHASEGVQYLGSARGSMGPMGTVVPVTRSPEKRGLWDPPAQQEGPTLPVYSAGPQ